MESPACPFMTGFDMYGPCWSNASLDLFYAFNDLICAIARAKDCLFVDLLSAYGEAEWMIHSDGVHANDLGHRIIAHRVLEAIAQRCSCLARTSEHV